MNQWIRRQDAINAVGKSYRYESDRMTALQEVPSVDIKKELFEKLKHYIAGRISAVEGERQHDHITRNEEEWRVLELEMMQDFIETDLEQFLDTVSAGKDGQ